MKNTNKEDLVPAILAKGFVIINRSSAKNFLAIRPNMEMFELLEASWLEMEQAKMLSRTDDIPLKDLVLLREK